MRCEYGTENYIRNEYFDYLNSLPPKVRFAEKFRLETEVLDFEIRENDRIVGWFELNREVPEYRGFDDEKRTKAQIEIMDAPEKFASRTDADRGHTLADYETILQKGLMYYEEKLNSEQSLYPNDEFLKSMKSTLEHTLAFLERIENILSEKLSKCNESDRKRLERMRDIIKKVPYHPSENFDEAVQTVWIIHFLISIAGNAWYSISLGRVDQYMYPFYKKSLEAGMTRDEAKEIIRNLYELLNSYSDGACLMNVGSNYNELSELLIECQKEFRMPAPILGARISEDTPDRIWDLLIDDELFSMGQPTFYGEEPCVRALIEKGIEKNEAERFSNNSCMGINIPGNEFDSMWGSVISVSAILEAALGSGKLLKRDAEVPGIKSVMCLEDIYENFEKCAEYVMAICAKSYDVRVKRMEEIMPETFLSMLTPGCIEKHCDRISGAKYHCVTVECMGMINASDGIAAVKKLVFEDEKYTIEEISRAISEDFHGYEKLQSELKKCPKFSKNDAADECAVRVADILQRVIRSFSHDNVYYSPSLHTIDTNVSYGSWWHGGYDGRDPGAPFAKNAGPSNDARDTDPTSIVLSSTKILQRNFFGGQPIDINFDRENVLNNKNKIRSLIEVYFKRGGLQFQVNSLSSELLRKATDEPEKYPNLVVRVGGYSTYFSKLSPNIKEEFIERFEKSGC